MSHHAVSNRDIIKRLEQEVANLRAERDAAIQAREVAPAGPWKEINLPFCEMVRAVVDPARLAGLELVMDDGVHYLIGDVNPDGGREHGNAAFRRDQVVMSARIAVKR